MGMTIDEIIDTFDYIKHVGNGEFEYKHCREEIALDEAVIIMRKYQQLQADYENRLKADLKAFLVELQTEIEELCIDNILSEDEEDINRGIEMAADAIQEKINALSGGNEE